MYDSAVWISTHIQSTIHPHPHIARSWSRRYIYEKGRCLIRISLNLWRTPTSGVMALIDGSQASMTVKLGVFHGAIFVWTRVSTVERSIPTFRMRSWSLAVKGLMAPLPLGSRATLAAYVSASWPRLSRRGGTPDSTSRRSILVHLKAPRHLRTHAFCTVSKPFKLVFPNHTRLIHNLL